MALREWPLVAFTLLGQLAVGGFLFLVVPFFVSPKLTPAQTHRDPRLCLTLAAAGLLAAALITAFFHLGNPLNALSALNNLRSSWLSREIFFLLLTLVLWAGLALFRALKIKSAGLSAGLAAAAGLSGILFLFSMSRLYMLPTVKAWNILFTPVSFFLTALLLGASAAAAAWSAGAVPLPPGYARAVVLAAVLLAAAALVVTTLAAPRFGLWGPEASPGLKPPADPSLILFIARLALLFSGAALLILQLNKSFGRFPVAAPPAAPAAFFIFLAAEILGRFLFYAFHLK